MRWVRRLIEALSGPERIEGTVMAVLFAAVVSAGLFAIREHVDLHDEHARSDGAALARSLSRVPLGQLLPADDHMGAFHWLVSAQATPDFAYAVIVDPTSKVLAQRAAPGAAAPKTHVPKEPSSWVAERVFDVAGLSAPVREFSAPILSDGELVALVRVGIAQAGVAGFWTGHSFVPVLGLLVLMFGALWYFLAKQRSRLIRFLGEQVQALGESRSLSARLSAGPAEGQQLVGRVQSLVQQLEDNARRMEAERTEALATSRVLGFEKSRIAAVLESIPDATVVIDERGIATYANAKVENLIRVRSADVVGHRVHEWCPYSEAAEFLADYCSTKRLQRASSHTVAVDDERHLRVGASPLNAGDAEWSGTLVTFRDVTAEVIAQRAQDEFVTQVAHELKAPLHALGMYADVLLDEGSEANPDLRIEACNVIRDQVERLAELITTLLAIARFETGHVGLDRQPVRLLDFLKDTFETVSRGRLRDDVAFELDLPPKLSPISVDKELLRVSLNNFLTNAIKYNRPDGTVQLSAEETPKELILRVRDTGIGIAPEDQERVFDKFYRSDRDEVVKVGGHGLGLTLARQIVELHGGRVSLKSALGEGTEFTLTFSKAAIAHRDKKE